MGRLSLNNVTLVSICGDSKFLTQIMQAAKQCMKYIDFGAVKIFSNKSIFVPDIEIIKIPPLNREDYCLFSLYKLPSFIDTDFCLTFQGDGFVINPSLWSDDFLSYDYIGAPWLNKEYNRVGNGGFSLRSKKFLSSAKTLEYNSKIEFREMIKDENEEIITPEDWFVCRYSYNDMVDMGVKFADLQTAYRFAVEHPSQHKKYNRYDINTYNSFGFHGSFNAAAMKLLEEK